MLSKLTNFVAFQLCWLACVLGAANGQPLLGPAVVGAWALAHLLLVDASRESEIGLMLSAALVGIVGDSVLALGGWLEFPAYARLGAPTTVWMVALWVAFATTLGHSLGWLRGRYVLAAVAGAVCGPLAYWAGTRLGAIAMPRGTQSLLAVSALWLVATPVLLRAQFHLAQHPARAAGTS